jgi:hypothetical protein
MINSEGADEAHPLGCAQDYCRMRGLRRPATGPAPRALSGFCQTSRPRSTRHCLRVQVQWRPDVFSEGKPNESKQSGHMQSARCCLIGGAQGQVKETHSCPKQPRKAWAAASGFAAGHLCRKCATEGQPINQHTPITTVGWPLLEKVANGKGIPWSYGLPAKHRHQSDTHLVSVQY